MTIAACFLSTEGVVLGADSTVTLGGGPSARYFDNEQKVFEVGREGTLGLVLWGSVPESVSFRTIVATFADTLQAHPAASVKDVADRWASYAWEALREAHQEMLKIALAGLAKVQAGKEADVTEDEVEAATYLNEFRTGFCIGGHMGPSRAPAAYEIEVRLTSLTAPEPTALTTGHLNFWGVPNMFRRLLHGVDWRILDAVLDAKDQAGNKLWVGSEDDLYNIAFAEQMIVPRGLPIRDAIDLVHFSIVATIKALKFSRFAQPTCGGPVEVAVVTSDRAFRWVKHKSFDSAI